MAKRKSNQGIVASMVGADLIGRALPVAHKIVERATRTATRGNKKRNTAERAARSYRGFHGRDPEVDTVIETEMREHSVLPGIGELCWLVIRYDDGHGNECDVRLEEFGGALLCSNEDRHHRPQLYIEGGDQQVDIRQFGLGKPLHEFETLGRVVCVAYFTTKDHLGEDGGEAEYVHVIEMPLDDKEFREWGLHKMGWTWAELEEETEGAVGPDVVYDTRNRLMQLSGGSYTIPDEGIDH